MTDDPICVCGTELSGHHGWDNHAFLSAEDYYRDPTPTIREELTPTTADDETKETTA